MPITVVGTDDAWDEFEDACGEFEDGCDELEDACAGAIMLRSCGGEWSWIHKIQRKEKGFEQGDVLVC